MDRLPLRHLFIFGALSAALCSCSSRIPTKEEACYTEQSDRWVVCDKERGYTFWYPHWIEEGDKVTKDVEVYTYDVSQTCTPSLTGVSKTEPLTGTNGKSEWGRVDAWDSFMPEFPEGEPKCKPGVVAWIATGDVEGQRELSPETRTAYALCSEHDGKTVLVCIDQITNNPALAEQIFRTFRWTN